MKRGEANRHYEAGFSDAQSLAIYNLRFAIRDIVELGESPAERLQQLEHELSNLEMPPEDWS